MTMKSATDDPELDEMDFASAADEDEGRKFECLQLALTWANNQVGYRDSNESEQPVQTCRISPDAIVRAASRFEAYLKGSFDAHTSN